MPIYEYRCEKCNQTFSVKMSMAEHEQGNIACPACRESRVIPHYSTFYAKTSKKS
jgi:putative FmdB family regulatory protein